MIKVQSLRTTMQEGDVPYRRLGSVGLTLSTQVSNVEKYSQCLKTLKIKKYP